MSKHTYTAQVVWERGPAEPFTDHRYSRRHALRFDGGAVVPGSSSPLSVRLPYSDAAAVDPEEMLVASASSCHMLWFLGLAAQEGFRVDRYDDHAEGTMEPDAAGKVAITRIVLRPDIAFGGERRPSAEQLAHLHHRAHEECFIASSLKSEIVVEPPCTSPPHSS
jgi:organic hydroperoxide reductase OsmC/OhrA